ncbi:AMP-binding protein, partial [Mycetohabitans sp. B2]|uniref:phosphopantetheine-binding protein n=1 Tax=Mycetohabitans sp. B2 TaxID=2841274 RepID=UPI001F3139B8
SQPVPLGAVGELYIGGAGVARGYLNRPELTAERFVPDPFSAAPDARMYKTGDLARYLPNGNLEYLGRNDQQVKIRGFRIEPSEIEARLTEHPQVRDAVVLARGEGNEKRLIAYVVAKPNENLVSALRAHVAACLPEYMVPTAFVRLDAFPLTPNGKLDRRALPMPNEDAFAHQAYEAPQGKVETALAVIWAELLGVERVSRHDSFFALGGHSLLAVQLIERLRRRGLGLSVRALFDTPTLSALAQSVGQQRDVMVPPNVITPDTIALTPEMLPLIKLTQSDIDRIVEQVPKGVANIQDIYALSPLQDGILFHH